MSLRAFQRPFTIVERCIFMWVIWTLHDVAAAGHIVLTVSWAVQFVGIITTVVLLVAFERRVNTLAVWAVERTCEVIPSLWIIILFHGEIWRTTRQPLCDRLHHVARNSRERTYRKGRRQHDTWKEEATRTWSVPTYAGRPSRRRPRIHRSADLAA